MDLDHHEVPQWDEYHGLLHGFMYAGIIVVAALGYGLNRLFLTVEARVLKWHHGMLARQAA